MMSEIVGHEADTMPKLKLTNSIAKSLQADPSKNVLYRDTAMPGLALRITRNGHKTFVFNYSFGGRERRMRIGEFPGAWTVEVAREQVKELKRLVDGGVDPLAQRQDKAAEPDLNALWAAFRSDHLPNVSEKYRADQEHYWAQYILPGLGERKLSSLTSYDVDVLHRKISEMAPIAANRAVASLRKALNYAQRRDWVAKNVVEGVRFNREEGRQRYLTDDELKRLISALDRMPNRQAADAILMLLLTGARRSEVLGAKWEEFDLEKGNWTKPAGRVKTRRTTTITLSSNAIQLLKRMSVEKSSEYLFPSRNGGPIQDIKGPWAWLLKDAGLEDFRIHDIRHSHASILVSHGSSLELIGHLLGHTQAQTTKRYAHLMQDPQREALAGLDAVISAARTHSDT